MRKGRQRAAKTDTAIRREQILQAALRVIGASGPRALTVAAVAAQVGVVPSGIYRHFHGKDAIFDAVFDFIRRRLLANAAAVRAQSGDAEERLRLLHLRHLRLIRAQRGLPRLLFSDEAAGNNPASRQRLLAVIQAYLADVADMIRLGQEAGTLRSDMMPETAALLFLGLIQPSVILWHLSDGSFDVTSESRRCWRLFSDAIRAEAPTATPRGTIECKTTMENLHGAVAGHGGHAAAGAASGTAEHKHD